MLEKNRKKEKGLGLVTALAASVLAYAYYSMEIQGRSLKSRLYEDGCRIRRFFKPEENPQSIENEVLNDLATAKPFEINIETQQRFGIHKADTGYGSYFLLRPYRIEPRGLVYYLADGDRVKGIQEAEWRFLSRLVERAQVTVIVLPTRLLNQATMAEEVSRLASLLNNSSMPGDNLPTCLLGTGSGAMFALGLYQKIQDTYLIDKIILLAPWLDGTLAKVQDESATSQSLARLQFIKSLWSIKENLPDYTKMAIADLPAIVFMTGTEDVHRPETKELYLRFELEEKPAKYYSFDYMPYNFMFLDFEESEEALNILARELDGDKGIKKGEEG